MLGKTIIYHTPTEHLTTTTKSHVGEEPVELEGSIHHPEQSDFTGLVTAEHKRGATEKESFDIVIFPPGRAPVHVADVLEGDAPGEFEYFD